MTASSPSPKLRAIYSSSTNEAFSVSKHLPPPASSSVVDTSAYLNALRAAVASAQEDINRELTTRMEEDKAREAAAGAKEGRGTKKRSFDEAKEEENYGEEVVEED